MGENTKPIQRSKELAPLSREHHEGLLLGWKVKQGLSNGTDLKLIAQYIQWFWKNELIEHFRKEEEILAPYLPSDNELIKRMFSEYEEIKKLVELTEIEPNETLFLQLANLLNEHIRFEERVLFPFAEKLLTPSELEAINHQLVATHSKNPWTEEGFWIKKKAN